MRSSIVLTTLLLSLFLSSGTLSAQLATGAESFAREDKIVSTTWFHWYAVNGGQLSGPWQPLDGRENWTGLAPWWKTQIKQGMMANIDVLLVHLIPTAEERREPFFKALGELRAEGYDVPKVAPFLDPLITWFEQPNVNLATAAGKDVFADQYIRWYTQYFNNNPDALAGDYLAKIDDRLIFSTWHLFLNYDNPTALSMSDVMGRMQTAFPDRPEFEEDIYMITPALNDPTFNFTEERWPLFEINEYYREVDYNGIQAAQLKPGYWDQNVRTPGSFLPRDGGSHYRDAWGQVGGGLDRVYVESWNEYDEGTGIYAGSTNAPVRINTNTNTDVWSDTNDPYEYIRTTAAGATTFNSVADLDALVLENDFPADVTANTTVNASITIRNTGDIAWTGSEGFTLQQLAADGAQFSSTGTIDDSTNEIPIYGGIFRGRPITFNLMLQVPDVRGQVTTNWSMMLNGQPFGAPFTAEFNVLPPAGVSDIGPDIDLSIFPNPTTDAIRLDWKARALTGKAKIYDHTGREVLSISKLAVGDSIPLGLPSGTYQIVLSVGEGRYARRIIVQ